MQAQDEESSLVLACAPPFPEKKQKARVALLASQRIAFVLS